MSKSFRTALLLLALSVVAFAALTTPVAAATVDKAGWPTQLRFMAGPPGGNWSTLGTALAEMWTDVGLPKTTSTSGGGVSNIVNANSGKGDLGFSVTSMLGAATQEGGADFTEGRKMENAVLMANLYTQYTYFIMRKDYAEKNGIKSVEDMIAKKLPVRFATLAPATSSEFVVKALFDRGYGLDYKKAIEEWGGSVEHASYQDGAALLANNHLDCFAFSVGKVASIVMNIEREVDIVLLPVGQEVLDKLAAAYGTATFIVEPGIYKAVPQGAEPVKVVGDFTCIVVRRDLPESLVSELNRAIWDNKRTLIAAVKDVQELQPNTATSDTVPTHPGSLAYWQSMELNP